MATVFICLGTLQDSSALIWNWLSCKSTFPLHQHFWLGQVTPFFCARATMPTRSHMLAAILSAPDFRCRFIKKEQKYPRTKVTAWTKAQWSNVAKQKLIEWLLRSRALPSTWSWVSMFTIWTHLHTSKYEVGPNFHHTTRRKCYSQKCVKGISLHQNFLFKAANKPMPFSF